MKNKILVVGGTGKTGRRVAELLINKKQDIRIGSRKNDPPFDWNDPAAWPEALREVDKVYLTYYPDLAVPGAYESVSKFLEIAVSSGVKKVVLLSGKGEKEAERCEQLVAQSGLDYVLIRASWFSQNFSESFLLEPILAGHVALPMPDAKIPFVDADDIAEAVVKTLLEDKYNGNTYEITGPKALSFGEAIKTISEELGRNIVFQPVSQAIYNEHMKSAGVPDDYIWLFDYLFREVLANPANQAISSDFENLIGRPSTSFRTYVRNTKTSGVWDQKVPQSV